MMSIPSKVILLLAVFLIAGLGGPGVVRAQSEPQEEPRDFRFDFGIFAGSHFYAKDHGLGRSQGDDTGKSPWLRPRP